MNDTNQGPKLDETKQVPKVDEPKSVPNQGETKQMPWSYEAKQKPWVNEEKPVPPTPKVPASAISFSETKEEPKPAPKVAEPRPTPIMPAPKASEPKPAQMPAPKVAEDKKMPKQDAKKIVRLPRKKFLTVTAIILVVLILLAFGMIFMRGKWNPLGNDILLAPSADSLGILYSGKSPQNYNGGNPQPSITDTREFLKINYSASIKTRNVDEVINNVQNIVKGSDGRVDSVYSSKRSGYIGFVVAQSKFDAFKSQIENLTNKKLYTENISSENLLGQKQGINAQTGNSANTLANLKAQKISLDARHTQTLNYIVVEIARLETDLASTRTSIATTTNSQTLAKLKDKESSDIRQVAAQQKLMDAENSSYEIKSQNIESLKNNENGNGIDGNIQGSQFTGNIETVNGYVSANWASLWEMARIFSPIPPIIIIIILIIIIIFCLRRYSRIPRIELE